METKKLEISINHIFRYGYSGFLMALVAAAIDPERSKMILDTLGPVISPLAILSIGGVAYAFYRSLFGDIIAFPLGDLVHWIVNRGRCRLVSVEKDFGVRWLDRLDAYRLIRDKLFVEDNAKRFELSHSENHLLLQSSFVFLVSSAYLFPAGMWTYAWGSVIVGVILLIAGVIADILLCRREDSHLKALESDKVKALLKQARFLN